MSILQQPNCVGRTRLRWRARRGLLENDLILSRFLEKYEDTMTESEVTAFLALMNLHDNELMDLLLIRKELKGELNVPQVRALLGRIRTS